ncbi:MAG: cystathionine gamma-synthase [Bacteroidetes bacterium]|nr:cystathionine gamma-synthase [Bacteroidota bacterium]
MKFGTKVIHAGIYPDKATGAVMTPIYQTSTYAQESPGKHKGYEYSRTQNPTRAVLEANLAALENAEYGLCFASGLAAMDAIFRLLNPGDEIVASNDLYGGSYRQITKVHERYGLKGHFVPMNDLSNIKEAVNENTRLIWVETPTNPMLNIVDIKEICDFGREAGIWVCVDNTFASPYLQNPIDLGADMVLHSATKYLGGHSDVVMGAVVVKDGAVAEQLAFIQNSVGAIPGPQDCFLVLRGIKTLHLRVQRACDNAAMIAAFLADHPKVKHVYWPGFKDHPNHEIAKSQMRDFGGMVSFNLIEDSTEAANRVLSNTAIFTLAESLGGVESLIGHPASMTHAAIPREERMKVGLTDSLIRLSVGVEDVDDLIQDLKKAIG